MCLAWITTFTLDSKQGSSGSTQVVGFVPTGWMYEMKRSTFPTRSKGPCTVHLVPYSEHSSYEELREYVRFLKPHQVRLGMTVESNLLHLKT